jgi:hypothetical protein
VRAGSGHRRSLTVLGLFGLAAGLMMLLTWVPAPTGIRYTAAWGLLWLLPALSWVRVLPGDRMTRLTSGLGLAFAVSGLLTLGLHYLPGPFPRGMARWIYALGALLPFGFPSASREDVPPRPEFARGVLVALIIAALVRLPNLAYSEFQGDEAVIMSRAAQALEGDDGELFLHQKGPVEVLIPMSLWSLTGTTSEWQVRLPFALMGCLAVMAIALLADGWFGPRAGALAGMLAGIAGFLVAFSRIVQYQNVVVAMGCLALLWLTEAVERQRDAGVLLGAAFTAYGLLAHYDAVLIGPAGLWLLGRYLFIDPAWRPRRIRVLAVGVGIGVLILSSFYLPFVLNPMFDRTFAYLTAGRMGGDAWFHNSLSSVWRMSVFYNALAYVVGLGLLLVGAAVLGLGTPAAWLTFVVPFLFYAFVVIDPRTHVYTLYPGAAVLAAGTLAWLGRRVRRYARPWTYGTFAVMALWYGLSACYMMVAFLSHTPEYKRTWPESRHPLYPVPFSDDALPPYGHFGFPYRAGWKAVNALFVDGTLHGTYASNEEPEITTWYVREGQRTLCPHPDFYIVAERVQDEITIDWADLQRAYVRWGTIFVGPEAKITIYGHPPAPTPPLTLQASDYGRRYDASTTSRAQLPSTYRGAHPVGVDFGSVARLLGYDLSDETVAYDDRLTVTLFWEALRSPRLNYQVFVHLMADGELVAQHDGAPACDHAPTSLWESGEIVRDAHSVMMDRSIPEGVLEIRVGMYNLLTLERLPVENSITDTLRLEEITLAP